MQKQGMAAEIAADILIILENRGKVNRKAPLVDYTSQFVTVESPKSHSPMSRSSFFAVDFLIFPLQW